MVAVNDLKRMHRIDLTLHILKTHELGYTTSLPSRGQLERFTALAAIDVCTTRPLLGAAILLRGNDRALRELRRTFPQHRRSIDNVCSLSRALDRRLPPKASEVRASVRRSDRASSPRKASAQALNAARQAISELGPDANRQALLARAGIIWKSRRRAEHWRRALWIYCN